MATSSSRWVSQGWSDATVTGNRVAVCGETTDLDAYMKIFNSPATADAMAIDGVKRETVQIFVLDKSLDV